MISSQVSRLRYLRPNQDHRGIRICLNHIRNDGKGEATSPPRKCHPSPSSSRAIGTWSAATSQYRRQPCSRRQCGVSAIASGHKDSFDRTRSLEVASLHTTNNANPLISLGTSTNIRHMSSSDEIRRGTDLLADSLEHGPRRKIVLESYAPSGVDVKGLVRVGPVAAEGDLTGEDKIVHMHGSIVAFPDACFLWKVKRPEGVNLESLSVVRLYSPVVEYLFIGCEGGVVPPKEMAKIKKEFRKKGVVVEQMDIMNAMGTFNILNGEDRRVACVLVIDPGDDN